MAINNDLLEKALLYAGGREQFERLYRRLRKTTLILMKTGLNY